MGKAQILQYGVPALGLLLSVATLYFAIRAGRRRRLLADLPTCKTSGVFIGLVELTGTAEAEQPLVSYLAGVRCVDYRWSVTEHWSRTVTESYTNSKGHRQTRTRTESGWTTIASSQEQIDFYLRDDCGVIRIRPDWATVEGARVFNVTCGRGDRLYYQKGPFSSVPNSTHRRCFTEHAIPLHAPLYVVGQARERDDVVAPEIVYDPNVELFLISTRTEHQVRRGLAWQFWLVGVFSLLLGLGGFLVRDAGLHRPVSTQAFEYVLVTAGVAASWFVAWGLMVYNSLVTLRQRVNQAWSNVDVQLQRRHDLIPNLVKTVEGMRDYEQTVQTELARLRAELQATPPGQPGANPHAVAPVLLALQERYPELKANDVFQGLFHNLVDTEQRLALARGYFNEMGSFYNARLQLIPDRVFAAAAKLKPQVLMTADAFERAPVDVKLAEDPTEEINRSSGQA